MTRSFTVERVALHLVDRDLPAPVFSPHEVDLSAIGTDEDRATIEDFFDGHLKRIWEAEEGDRTRGVTFMAASPVAQICEDLRTDPSTFFAHSCSLAQRLYDVSTQGNISRGLLTVLWLRDLDGQPFLAILKMDPGRADKITLRQQAGKVLMELAVQHVEQALPDPGDRVLKWAVVPHPSRPDYHAKVKDEETKREPALYFVKFLGCERKQPEKKMARSLVEAVEKYGDEVHPDQNWREPIDEVLDDLQRTRAVVTTDVLVARIQETNRLPGFKEAEFRKAVDEVTGGQGVAVPADLLGRVEIEYELAGGITIRGSRRDVESLVHVEEVADGHEFRIRTPRYDKRVIVR